MPLIACIGLFNPARAGAQPVEEGDPDGGRHAK